MANCSSNGVILFVCLALLASGASALFGIGDPPAAAATPGAGKSVLDVICATADLSTTCSVIRAAVNDPTVAELTDPTYTGTFFAPTNKAWEDSIKRISSQLKVPDVAGLKRRAGVAGKVIGTGLITGQALQFAQLKNGLEFVNAAGTKLKIESGYLWGLYIKGPVNRVRLEQSATKNNIPAARAYIHKVDEVLIAKSA